MLTFGEFEDPGQEDPGQMEQPDMEAPVAAVVVLDFLRTLWGSGPFLAKFVLAGTMVGLLLGFLLPSRYVAVARLMPPSTQPGSGMAMLAAISGKGDGMAGAAGDLLGMSGGSGALFAGILQSETVEDRLVERFDLRQVYRDRLEQDARQDLAERTGIAEDRKSGIITITVTDRDPRRAAAITAAYIEELNRLSAELSTSAAHRERVFLEERLRDVKLDLDRAAQDFSRFSSQNTAIDIKEQARAMVEAAAQLQGELIAAESQQKGLEAIYASGNSRVRAVAARVTELRKQLEQLGGAEEAAPGAAGVYPSIRQLPILGVKYADLFRRTRIEETIYETLTEQYELAKVQEAKETPVVKVLDPAQLPERRSFPPRLAIVLLCATLAAATGSVSAIGGKWWQRVDAADPWKLFIEEIFRSAKNRLPPLLSKSSRGQVAERISKWKRAMEAKTRAQVSGEPTNQP